jgi:hypothetical protein
MHLVTHRLEPEGSNAGARARDLEIREISSGMAGSDRD